MKFVQLLCMRTLLVTLILPSVIRAESNPELAFSSIPPEAMQAIDSINESLANRSIPFFDGRVLSAGIGALAGVWIYNLLPSASAAVVNGAGTAVISAAATNQLPMLTSAVIGVWIADYLYRQSGTIANFD